MLLRQKVKRKRKNLKVPRQNLLLPRKNEALSAFSSAEIAEIWEYGKWKAFDFGKTLVPPFFALTEGLPEFIIEDIRGPKKQVA